MQNIVFPIPNQPVDEIGEVGDSVAVLLTVQMGSAPKVNV